MIHDFVDQHWQGKVVTSIIHRDAVCLSAKADSRPRLRDDDQREPVRVPLRSIDTLRENPARDDHLIVEEKLQVIAQALPNAAFAIEFAIDTGLRKKEMLRLRTEDIDLRNRRIFVRSEDAKSGKGRWVPLLPRSLEQLRRADLSCPHLFMTEEGQPYSPLSPYFYEALLRAVRRAGLKKHVEWHDLRRTCGCRLLQGLGLPIEYVSAWLGHTCLLVTGAGLLSAIFPLGPAFLIIWPISTVSYLSSALEICRSVSQSPRIRRARLSAQPC